MLRRPRKYHPYHVVIILAALLAASAAPAATVQISWDANSEPDLAGYRIYSGTQSGNYGEPVDVGNVTEHVMQIAPEYGATYYFALTAYDTSGNESGHSDEASVFVPDSAAPETPKGLIARIVDAIVGWFKGILGVSARVV